MIEFILGAMGLALFIYIGFIALNLCLFVAMLAIGGIGIVFEKIINAFKAPEVIVNPVKDKVRMVKTPLTPIR